MAEAAVLVVAHNDGTIVCPASPLSQTNDNSTSSHVYNYMFDAPAVPIYLLINLHSRIRISVARLQ